jgi:hypothetical protein
MATNRYPNNLGGATPTGATIVAPTRSPNYGRPGKVLGTPGSVNNPVPGGPGQTGGNQFTIFGTPLGNPNYPCIAGAEILPIESVTVPIDLGTRYDFHHYLNNASLGMQRGEATAQFEKANARQQHTIAFDLYGYGNHLTNDEVTTVIMPLRRADLGPTSVVVGGGSALVALQTPGGTYVEMDGSLANSWLALWFDPLYLNTNYAAARVVRIGLRWLAWKDDSATPTPGEGFSVKEWDTVMSASGVEYGNWLVNDYQRNAQYTTRWLGETNFLTRGQPVTNEHNREPFTVADLNHMGPLDELLFWQLTGQVGYDSSQTTTYLDYIEMIVEVVPERRAAVGSRVVSNLISDATHDYSYDWDYPVQWRYSLETSSLVQLIGTHYVLAVREAIPADSSDRYRADPDGAFNWTFPEAIGPSLQVMGISQIRPTQSPQLETYIGTVSDGILVGTPRPFEDYNLGIDHYNSETLATTGAFWAGYQGMSSLYRISIYDGGSDSQFIFTDGYTTYTRLKMLVKPDALTQADLTFVIYSGGVQVSTVSVSAASIRALDDDGGGWKEFEVLLNPAITPPSGAVTVIISSTTPQVAPWFISAADSIGTPDLMRFFGYWYDFTGRDFALTLVCEPDVPPAPTAQTTISSVVAGASCGITDIRYYTLTWATTSGAERYEVQRKLTSDVDWTTVAIVENTYPTAATYYDLATPWDVSVDYRIGGYRTSDMVLVFGPITTTGPLSSQGAALGISDTDNNVMIYVPTVAAGSLSTAWNDLNKTEMVQLLGEDFNRAMQAPEDRGLSFTTQVLVADLFPCTAGHVDPLTVGQRSLSPTPYDLLRTFARQPYVNARFPGGMVRQMVLQLGSLTVRNQFGVYLAEIVLTDAFVPGLDVTEEVI